MIKKTVKIDGKEITFKMSAATPRIYRAQFQQDLIFEMQKEMTDLELIENLSWVAAGCPGKSVEKWLETLPPSFAVDMPDIILSMWTENNATVATGSEALEDKDSKNAAKEES